MVGGIGNSGYSGYGVSGYGNAYGARSSVGTEELKKSGSVECATCASRQYKDGSNEADVSFKAPGHISPESSAATVMSHEQEHVANAYEKAGKNNGKVISASVTLHTAVCPECGRSYVSGGVTNTLIKYSKNTTDSYGSDGKKTSSIDSVGKNIDYAV